jgi:hypothetical protein
MRYVLMVFALMVSAPLWADPLSSMRSCRSELDDRQRLACYDRAVDDVAAQPEAVDPPALITAEDVFGRESAASADRIFGVRTPDDVRSVVEKLMWTTDGRLLINLRNGHVWAQSDTTRRELAPGDEIVVRKAQLGSFMLRRADGKRSMRVRRVD